VTAVTEGAPRRSLALAGVWEFWRSREGEPFLVTAAVLTTAAVGKLARIHDRMPLLVAPGDWAAWLDPDAGPPHRLLRPPSESMVAGLELRPVSSKVNNVSHNGPDLVAPVVPNEPAEPALALDLPGQASSGRSPLGSEGRG
jgi:putative SOS response-associated peptidase YedK